MDVAQIKKIESELRRRIESAFQQEQERRQAEEQRKKEEQERRRKDREEREAKGQTPEEEEEALRVQLEEKIQKEMEQKFGFSLNFDKFSSADSASENDTRLSELGRPLICIADDDDERSMVIRASADQEGCQVGRWHTSSEATQQILSKNPLVVFVSKHFNGGAPLPIVRLAQRHNAAVVMHGEFHTAEDVRFASQMGVVSCLAVPLFIETVTPSLISALAFAKNVLKRNVALSSATASTAGDAGNGSTAAAIRNKAKFLLDQADSALALPQATARIIEMCSQQNVDTARLAKHLEMDPAISATLFKRANSAAFGGSKKITAVKDVIVRLGFQMVRSIVTLMSVYRFSDASAKSFMFNRLGCWTHSLGVGLIAAELSKQISFGNQADLFLAGVLHDLGCLLFDDHLHKEHIVMLQKAANQRLSRLAAETETFGMTHDHLGGEITLRWHLPKEICDAIATHHDPIGNQMPEQLSIGKVIFVANLMAKALLIGSGGDNFSEPLPDHIWKGFQMDKMPLRAFIGTIIDGAVEHANLLGLSKEKAGLEPVTPSKDQWVYVMEGEISDRLLDLFFGLQGLNTAHSQDSDSLGANPVIVVYDLRMGALELTDNSRSRIAGSKAIHIVIKDDKLEMPEFVPSGADVLQTPLDFMEFQQVFQKHVNALQSTASVAGEAQSNLP
jgi:HD-like signal output (HDOD) protein